MDVWSLTERYKALSSNYKELEARLKHVEGYLKEISRRIGKDEVVQDKQDKPSSVRTRRQTTKKS